MKEAKLYRLAKIRRKIKVRAKIKGTSDRPRLSVFRSNRFIYAQLIDDEKGKTLISVSEKALQKTWPKLRSKKAKLEKAKKQPSQSGVKSERAYSAGKLLAEEALKKGIKKVIFDRGSYQYHGRVKNLAEGAREGGLSF